nr:MAG TPA: hypothetical protein [Caudoviricetes sp.]
MSLFIKISTKLDLISTKSRLHANLWAEKKTRA